MVALTALLQATLVFLTICAAGWGLWMTLALRQRARRSALAVRVGVADPFEGGSSDLTPTLRPAPLWLGPFGPWLQRMALRAGRQDDLSWIIQQLVLIGLTTSVLLFPFLRGRAFLVAAALCAIPLWRLHRAGQERTRQIANQLPDALDFIVRSLRAGHGFSDALQQACGELPQPIRGELATVAEMSRLGAPLRQGFERLVESNPDNQELRLFSSAVQLHRHTGGNLIDILEQLAETVRERLVFEHKVRSLTAEVRMSSRILGSLPFLSAGMLFVASPAYLYVLVEEPAGRAVLVVASSLMLIGLWGMQRIARVEVL